MQEHSKKEDIAIVLSVIMPNKVFDPIILITKDGLKRKNQVI